MASAAIWSFFSFFALFARLFGLFLCRLDGRWSLSSSQSSSFLFLIFYRLTSVWLLSATVLSCEWLPFHFLSVTAAPQRLIQYFPSTNGVRARVRFICHKHFLAAAVTAVAALFKSFRSTWTRIVFFSSLLHSRSRSFARILLFSLITHFNQFEFEYVRRGELRTWRAREKVVARRREKNRSPTKRNWTSSC